MSNSSVFPVGNWIDNSLGPIDVATDDYVRLNYAVIGLSSFILVHSFYLHRFKRSSVRICNDIAASSTLTICLLNLQCINLCSVFDNAMIINIGVNAICGVCICLSDNYMTFKRYDVVVGRTSTQHKILALLYVIFISLGSWWPFYTIIPFVRNMNNDDSILLFTYSQYYWNFPTYAGFNLFYDGLLVYEVYRIRSASIVQESANNDVPQILLLVYKAIIHNICSTFAVCAYCFFYPLGALIQSIIVMSSIHFIFNWTYPFKFLAKIGVVVASEVSKRSLNFSTRLGRSRKIHLYEQPAGAQQASSLPASDMGPNQLSAISGHRGSIISNKAREQLEGVELTI